MKKSRLSQKIEKIHTGYVWANTRKCKACWKCVDACPQNVIGKVGALWHRHIAFKNSEACTGCKKCEEVCPCGVFSEEMPDILKKMAIFAADDRK